VWTRCIWLRIETSGGLLLTGDELSGSTKGGEFLDYRSDYQLLKKDSAPLSQSVSTHYSRPASNPPRKDLMSFVVSYSWFILFTTISQM
jgi:hypothetical protein